jgi:hypothetical protein
MTDRMTPEGEQSELDGEKSDRDQTTLDSDRPDYLTETKPMRSWPRALDTEPSSD